MKARSLDLWVTKALPVLCWALIWMAHGQAWSQYLDPEPPGGYLEGPPAQPSPPDDLYWGAEEPLVRIGGGLYLGAGYTDYGDLDRSFFAPNRAKEFGELIPFGLEGNFWIQFGRHARLGLQGENLLAGSGTNFTHSGSIGLLGEGGGPLGQGWSAWGGGVVGYTHLNAESKDEQSRWLEYSGDFLHLRAQASLEKELLPFLSLRGTLFYQYDGLYDEEFHAQSRDALIPWETGFDRHSVGLLLGVLFHT
ncbi:MAG: hypothetical protein JW797_15295 [Bradymonadales bacterium]|nr:hypothetical protein [Bradymonadales bacterium]